MNTAAQLSSGGQNRIGIDLGGTKIEGVVLSAAGEAIAQERIATPRSYDASISALTDLVQRLEVSVGGTATVGMGIPGVVVPETGLVKNANSTWLNGRPLQRDLSAALARDVRVQNDANCFALSEATDGAAAGAPVVFGVILGTGIGGGVVVNGALLTGRNLIGGEWGHNPLPWPSHEEVPGPPCYCGKRGCIESWISGPGIASDHARVNGGGLTTPEIMDAASNGDAAARATYARFVERAGRALATIINVLDPHVIVLGGGLSNIVGVTDDIRAAVPGWVFSDSFSTDIVRHKHGDSSGVRGAAWLWPAS